MALPEWLYLPHLAAHGPAQQHQHRQGQALPLLVCSSQKARHIFTLSRLVFVVCWFIHFNGNTNGDNAIFL